MCMNYWLTACSSLPRKKLVRCTDRSAMTIAVDWDVKQQKKISKKKIISLVQINKAFVRKIVIISLSFSLNKGYGYSHRLNERVLLSTHNKCFG